MQRKCLYRRDFQNSMSSLQACGCEDLGDVVVPESISALQTPGIAEKPAGARSPVARCKPRVAP